MREAKDCPLESLLEESDFQFMSHRVNPDRIDSYRFVPERPVEADDTIFAQQSEIRGRMEQLDLAQSDIFSSSSIDYRNR